MRNYYQISGKFCEHQDILEEIRLFLERVTVPRDFDGDMTYLEKCYLSQKLFDRLTQHAKKLSEKEFVWLPTTKIPIYQIIFSSETLPDGKYYNISVIASGGDTIHFVGVSGTSYFFMDEGETSSYFG